MRRPACAALLALGVGVATVPAGATIVNDVTRINPIRVDEVLTPTSIAEIVEVVRTHRGPISIGGGRFSQGGQTATDGALQLDMRRFDKVLRVSKESREVTVETGITWRRLLETVAPLGFAPQIMQSYANFTVGGSLSVNVHGRYVGQGPLVISVRSIRIVLADGTLVSASPTENPEIFYGAIGGYGAMGVLVEATLALADNVKVERRSEVMPLAGYRKHFFETVRDKTDVIFHNADIYPGGWDTVRVTSFIRTDRPVTVPDLVIPADAGYWVDRMVVRALSWWPFGGALRRTIVDPLVYRGENVVWRSYEASYDVAQLEPVSRTASTYVLQEYFVPVDRLEELVARMGKILDRHHVNVLNVSIRHAKQDPGTLLAWAKTEVFAFVLYYKQGTTVAEREAVGGWTRELIDAAIALGGAYYLPYQIHATGSQFRTAYPRAGEFFALKRKLDPTNKFRNRLWDAYDVPASADGAAKPKRAPRSMVAVAPLVPEVARAIAAATSRVEGYARDEAQTFLTLPEWLLVYYPEEYAQYLEHKAPSGYPYFGAVRQFWSYTRDADRAARGRSSFNWGYQVMVSVIGASYTIENAAKGAYEHTLGRLVEAVSGTDTQEDAFGATVAREYVDFIRVTPWYEFSFASALKRLWAETDLVGPHLVRKWERKLALSAEYLVKAQYGSLIKIGTKLAYGDAETEVQAVLGNATTDVLAGEPAVRVIERFDDGSALVSLPRYEEFRREVLRLVDKGVYFREIAGNDGILVTVLAPASFQYDLDVGRILLEKPILGDPRTKRLGIEAPVPELHRILAQLEDRDAIIEHIYDY